MRTVHMTNGLEGTNICIGSKPKQNQTEKNVFTQFIRSINSVIFTQQIIVNYWRINFSEYICSSIRINFISFPTRKQLHVLAAFNFRSKKRKVKLKKNLKKIQSIRRTSRTGCGRSSVEMPHQPWVEQHKTPASLAPAHGTGAEYDFTIFKELFSQ